MKNLALTGLISTLFVSLAVSSPAVAASEQGKFLNCRLEKVTFDSAGVGHNLTLREWVLDLEKNVYGVDQKVGNIQIWIHGQNHQDDVVLQMIIDSRSSAGTWRGVSKEGFFAALDVDASVNHREIHSLVCFQKK